MNIIVYTDSTILEALSLYSSFKMVNHIELQNILPSPYEKILLRTQSVHNNPFSDENML